jgi:hypothetical protein
VLTINVKPGWKNGTRITFPKEGDVYPGRLPADITFVIKDKMHPKFKRDGSDIRFVIIFYYLLKIRVKIINLLIFDKFQTIINLILLNIININFKFLQLKFI